MKNVYEKNKSLSPRKRPMVENDQDTDLESPRRRYPTRTVSTPVKVPKKRTSERRASAKVAPKKKDVQLLKHGEIPVFHGKGCYERIYDEKVDKENNNPVKPEETCPTAVLRIARSQAFNQKRGVYAKVDIKSQTVFGPFIGKVITDVDEMRSTKKFLKGGYSWEIFDNGKLDFCISGATEQSNWMKIVNCARNDQEQNLEVFQYRKEIYYKAIKDIKRNEELLIYVGDMYGYYGRNGYI